MTLTETTPEIACSIKVPKLLLVVTPHVLDCSPVAISSIRKLGEYVDAMKVSFIESRLPEPSWGFAYQLHLAMYLIEYRLLVPTLLIDYRLF